MSRRHWALATIIASSVVGCSGGSNEAPSTLTLSAFSYGRGIINNGRFDLVSPLTFGEINVSTGYAEGSSIEAIDPSVDVEAEIRLDFEVHQPLVLPRNAVIALDFGGLVDPSSLRGDSLDDRGHVLKEGSLSIRFPDGRAIPLALSARGSRVFISPSKDERLAFPASPIIRDVHGKAIPYPGGWLSLHLSSNPATRLKMLSGSPVLVRDDRLGEEDNPIRFTPGHEDLDFIEQNSLLPFGTTFDGFLPAQVTPRIVRSFVHKGTLDFTEDSADLFSIRDVSESFEPRAKKGRGEWAEATIRLRPGKNSEERTTIESHSSNHLIFTTPLTTLPKNGDEYELSRDELFEPERGDPIDPEAFDPFNPQNQNNRRLVTFLSIQEIDSGAVAFGETLDPTSELPPRIQIAIRFTQPLSPNRTNAYESFTVSTVDPQSQREQLLPGRVDLDDRGFRAVWRPIVGTGEETRVHGLSPLATNYTLRIQTVPTLDYVAQNFGPSAASRVEKIGFVSLSSMGGVPLGFPKSLFDSSDNRVVYSADLNSRGWEGGPWMRAVVHTFQGRPEKRVDQDGHLSGVAFQDGEHLYGPTSQDINLQARGRLTGAPVQNIQRVFDSDNPTPDGSTDPGAFAFGATTPFSGYLFNNLIYQANFGTAMAMLYNHTWASPAPDAGASPYELQSVSWAAFNNFPGPDIFESLGLIVGHSVKRPEPSTSFQQGLGQERLWFDDDDPNQDNYCGDLFASGAPPSYELPLHQAIAQGTRSSFSEKALFSPPGSSFTYLKLFEFQEPFIYDNLRGLYFEVSVEPQPIPPSFFTAFTGNQITPGFSSPLLRNWTIGDDGSGGPFDPYLNLGNRRYDPTIGATRETCWQGPVPVQGASPYFGDNFIYYASFDWVKRRSTIESSFDGHDSLPPEKSIYWMEPTTFPNLDDIPFGTEAGLEFQGSQSRIENPAEPWSDDISNLDSLPYARFRLKLAGNATALSVPYFDVLVIPYEVRAPL